ncbi:MAG: hypothetical protein RIQ81_399 [Pseudomonadota bacterium]
MIGGYLSGMNASRLHTVAVPVQLAGTSWRICTALALALMTACGQAKVKANLTIGACPDNDPSCGATESTAPLPAFTIPPLEEVEGNASFPPVEGAKSYAIRIVVKDAAGTSEQTLVDTTTTTNSVDISNLPYGVSLFVYISAVNAAGQYFAATNSGSATWIRTPNPPAVTVTSPTNDTTPTWGWISGGVGNGTFRYRLDSNDFASGAITTTSTTLTPGSPLGEGTHTLYVQEQHESGTWSRTGSATVIIDTTLPTLSFNLVAGGNPGNTLRPVLLGTASEPSTITFYFGDSCTTTAKSEPSANAVFASPGIAVNANTQVDTITTIRGKAVDLAGNESACTLLVVYTNDSTPPTAGNSGTISDATAITTSSFAFSWTAASDTVTTSDNLQYLVCAAKTSTLGSIAACEQNAVTTWTQNVTSYTVTGLDRGTTHYYNVIARDHAGNKRLYSAKSTKTIGILVSAHGTASSPERKTFYDTASAKHWAFWFTGSDVGYGYSATGSNFSPAATPLAITTPRFTVTAKEGKVLIAYESSRDIMVRRGTISGTSITWDTPVTALDSSGNNDNFSRPAITVGTDDITYLAAFEHDATKGIYTPVVSRSSNAITGGTTWAARQTAGPVTSSPASLAIVPQGSYAMAVTSGQDGVIHSYAYDGTNWTQKTGSVSDWWTFAGIAGVSGAVHAIAVAGADLYIGGDFRQVGGTRPISYIARWNGTNWSGLGSGIEGQNAVVYALAATETYLYVGGNFSFAGGQAAANVAQWNLMMNTNDGWSTMNGGVTTPPSGSAEVRALAVIKGTTGHVYVGGTFTRAGGNAASNIAFYDGAGGWTSPGSGVSNGSPGSGIVYSLHAVTNTAVYVGGDFSVAGGAAASSIAFWDPGAWETANFSNDSSWRSLGQGTNGVIYAMAKSGTTLFVGGDFTSAGGDSSISYVARWSTTATTDAGWASLGGGVNGAVKAMAFAATSLYVTGDNLTSAGGASVKNIARWDTTNGTWSALGSAGSGVTNGNNSVVGALAVAGTDLYVGGIFTTAGTKSAANIARWDTTKTDDNGWSPVSTGISGSSSGVYCTGGSFKRIEAMAASGDNLYVGGCITSIAGLPVSNIAQWDGTKWSALTSGVNGLVTALAINGTDLYVGGYFSSAGGVSAKSIAKWNGSVWSSLGGGVTDASNNTAIVYALAITGNELYAGGSFAKADGNAAQNIAKWPLTGGSPAWSPLASGVNGTVTALAADATNNAMYVAGSFSTAGATNVSAIAKWNTTGSTNSDWTALGSGISGSVYALALSDPYLYVGGAFTAAGTVGTQGIARWQLNGSGNAGWSAMGSGVAHSSDTDVEALAVSGQTLYVSGAFTTAGTTAVKYAATWDTTKNDDTGWSASGSLNGNYGRVLAAGNSVYAGGEWGLAKWTSGLVARGNHISVTSDAANTHISYVSPSNRDPGEPEYSLFVQSHNGSNWGSPEWLLDDFQIGSTTLSSSTDGTQKLLVWENSPNSFMHYKFSSGTWSALGGPSSQPGYKRFPALPATFTAGGTVSLIWTVGYNFSDTQMELDSGALTLP